MNDLMQQCVLEIMDFGASGQSSHPGQWTPVGEPVYTRIATRANAPNSAPSPWLEVMSALVRDVELDTERLVLVRTLFGLLGLAMPRIAPPLLALQTPVEQHDSGLQCESTGCKNLEAVTARNLGMGQKAPAPVPTPMWATQALTDPVPADWKQWTHMARSGWPLRVQHRWNRALRSDHDTQPQPSMPYTR